MAKKLLTYNLTESLDGVKTAKVDINPGDGNLSIGSLNASDPLLATGTLQYPENHNPPVCSLDTSNGLTTLALKSGGGGQTWLRMPWSNCNGGTEWKVDLNPTVTYDLCVKTGGGIIKLDLSGMSIQSVQAETGGGVVELTLPEITADLSVSAKTGAGVVNLTLPAGIAASIYATTGMGKVIVDPQLIKVAEYTYQTADYASATKKAEITVGSGAGQVTISVK